MSHMGTAIPKTPAVLSSELRIKAIDSTHSFLLLEGSFDLRFWENRLNTDVVRPVVCCGKSNLVDVMALIKGGDLQPRVVGLADADFDRLMAREPENSLIWTDQNDLEMTLFLLQCSQPAQTFGERLLTSSVDPRKKIIFEREHACSVMEFVRRVVSQYGVLRFLNEREDWRINFSEVPILNTEWFHHQNLQLDCMALHKAMLPKITFSYSTRSDEKD